MTKEATVAKTESDLTEKIRAKMASGGVFGLGYIGLPFKRLKELNAWKLSSLSILFVALSARFVESRADLFGFDNYWMMRGVENGFLEYLETYSGFYFPLYVHY